MKRILTALTLALALLVAPAGLSIPDIETPDVSVWGFEIDGFEIDGFEIDRAQAHHSRYVQRYPSHPACTHSVATRNGVTYVFAGESSGQFFHHVDLSTGSHWHVGSCH